MSYIVGGLDSTWNPPFIKPRLSPIHWLPRWLRQPFALCHHSTMEVCSLFSCSRRLVNPCGSFTWIVTMGQQHRRVFKPSAWSRRPAIDRTSLLNLNCGGRGKALEHEMTRKHFEKLPDHHRLLPRLLGNPSLLFSRWTFRGIQLVRLFPYRWSSERHRCIVGYNAPKA